MSFCWPTSLCFSPSQRTGEEITDEFLLALLLTAFRRLALSRAAVPPEVWKVFDFPRRSFALASGCARHWPWAETLPDRRASRRLPKRAPFNDLP